MSLKSAAGHKGKAAFNVDEILEIEKETKHDVIAFLTNVAGYVGPDSRYIHEGLTSSDVVDTSLAMQMRDAGNIILADIENLIDVLAKRAVEFKYTLEMGRTHGIHAEPTTFGLKLLLWHEEMRRNLDRMKRRSIRSLSAKSREPSAPISTFHRQSKPLSAESLGWNPPRSLHRYCSATGMRNSPRRLPL